MEKLEIEFETFNGISLDTVLNNKIGVYIIWDARSKKRPTYIGEGNLLKRLCDHRDRKEEHFAVIDGYIGIIKKINKKFENFTENELKINSELVEYVLLDLSDKMGIYPVKNKNLGKFRSLYSNFKRGSRVLEIKIRGFNPLQPRYSLKYVKNVLDTIKLKVKQGIITYEEPKKIEKIFKLKFLE